MLIPRPGDDVLIHFPPELIEMTLPAFRATVIEVTDNSMCKSGKMIHYINEQRESYCCISFIKEIIPQEPHQISFNEIIGNNRWGH
jgi:hypothetical protein